MYIDISSLTFFHFDPFVFQCEVCDHALHLRFSKISCLLCFNLLIYPFLLSYFVAKESHNQKLDFF